MCTRITCPTCSKPTYSGCGAHIEAALRGVPPADRCRCREAQQQPRETAAPRRR